MFRNTCIKCGVAELDIRHHFAHVVPQWFCKDHNHMEELVIILCRDCHQKLEKDVLHFVLNWVNKQ